jgi:hypothetical protein
LRYRISRSMMFCGAASLDPADYQSGFLVFDLNDDAIRISFTKPRVSVKTRAATSSRKTVGYTVCHHY